MSDKNAKIEISNYGEPKSMDIGDQMAMVMRLLLHETERIDELQIRIFDLEHAVTKKVDRSYTE